MAEQEGRMQSAIESYRQAIRVEPNVTGARTNLVALLERNLNSRPAGSVDEATTRKLQAEISELRATELKLLARDVNLLPQAASIQYRYGLALYVDGQKDKALTHLLRAGELEPSNYEYVQAITLMYKSMRNWEEATRWAQKLIELAPPDNPDPAAIMREIDAHIP